MMSRKKQDHRICFVGDSFVVGTGDQDGLGWVGRVTATLIQAGWNLTAYNLGVRGHTSLDILKRWEGECPYRLENAECSYVVFSFGTNDMFLEKGSTRIGTRHSGKNFELILKKTQSRYNTYAIGPPPIADISHNVRIQELSGLYAEISGNLGIPYLSIVEPLLNNSMWREGVQEGDGAHPNAQGYGEMADIILRWKEWPFPYAERSV